MHEPFRSLVQNASDVIMILDERAVIVYVSPSVVGVLGYRPETLLKTAALALVHPEDVERARTLVPQALCTPGPQQRIELRVRHGNGSWRYLDLVASNLLHDPSIQGIVLNTRDVTDRRRFEDEVRRRAFYDALTGLPNRALFVDRLAHAVSLPPAGGRLVAVLFLGLDGFKVVNDSLGHAAGDRLLVAVGERLAGCLGPGMMLARFGGDEFTILVEDAGDEAAALAVAECAIDALQTPFALDGRDIFITASIGATVRRGDTAGLQPEDLVREADIALHHAKATGKARVALYDPAMNVRAVQRLELGNDLRRAIDHGELWLSYQPDIDVTTEQTVGMEALVRWSHPERGLIAPSEFVPLAEENGLILEIGRWVLEEACRQARDWQALAPAGASFVMSVNLSARQFQQCNLVEQVAEVLRRTGLDPSALKLEITEGAMMEDADSTLVMLRALKALGVRLAVDDFGTGYSSLSYLRRFPVDTLKIDRAFVRDVDRAPRAMAIVRAVTVLGHALGMDVTAEGVETAEQFRAVREAGCDRAQGYYFARPLTPAALSEMLGARERPAAP